MEETRSAHASRRRAAARRRRARRRARSCAPQARRARYRTGSASSPTCASPNKKNATPPPAASATARGWREIEAELGMLVSQFAQNPATDEECADVEARYRDEDRRGRRRSAAPARRTRAPLSQRQPQRRSRARRAGRTRTVPARANGRSGEGARDAARIDRRDRTCQTQAQFNETFERVARGVFRECTRGSSRAAKRRCGRPIPENLSETGIEIAVQPPGKKQMPLAALSGGERAMTAAALIFALIATKPSPFYLLDEVDAALDDANVERFSGWCANLRRRRRC